MCSVPDEDWQNDFDTKSFSKPRLASEGNINILTSSISSVIDSQWSRTVLRAIDHLEDAFDGVRSLSWGVFRKEDTGSKRARHVLASDLLYDESLRHLIILSNSDILQKDVSLSDDVCTTEIVRLRVCLPYMLYDEWYEDDKTILSTEDAVRLSVARRYRRARLIKALSSFVSHVGSLPSEVEAFIIHEVLPSYDGTEVYVLLFHEVVPFLTISSFKEFKHHVLRHLARIYPTALSEMKQSIVSGTLTGLLRRWGTKINSTSSAVDDRMARELLELVLWTDNLIMTGLIAEQASDFGGYELTLLSALDFFDAACVFSHGCGVVACPSPALIYRLLLPDTALCIDRVCSLLLKYKTLLEELKKRSLERTEAKVHIENSFVAQVGELERLVFHMV